METCATCGHPVDAHNRHVRFRWPEPILRGPQPVDELDIWLSHGDAMASVMMQANGVGAFVRALLPIRLTGGHRLTYGVWVSIHPDELRRTFSVWREPGYADLTLSGVLANPIPPWGLLYTPVELAVRDTEQTPYCEHSSDPGLSDALTRVWNHPTVLDPASE